MAIQVGEKLPSVLIWDAERQRVDLAELGKGKTMVLFAVPGAFTPTCSEQHLPGFVARSADLKAKGVDVIACIAVNDSFVMKAWAEERQVGDSILMLADGNGELTEALGLVKDARKSGLGLRSSRYAMLVVDGVVKQLAVDESGLAESSAEQVLGWL